MPAGLPKELPMRFTTTSDGVRIAYAVVGEGPTCVFALGPPNSHSQLAWRWRRDIYRPLVERLRLVFFDWRNTGLSDATGEPFTPESARRDLEAVVDATAPGEPISVLAMHGAGVVVMPWAADHPEPVERLALYCAAVRGEGFPRSYRSWRDILEDEPDVAVKLSVRAAIGWDSDPDPNFERFLWESSPLQYQAETEDLIYTLDVNDCLPRVACPTLVVGRESLPWPTAIEAGRMAAAFPQGRLLLLEGHSYLFDGDGPPSALVDFLASDSGRPVSQNGRWSAAEPLSPRGRDVLALIAAGKTNPEIAEALTIAPATASRHVHNILEKLGMRRRSEAVAYALREGLVD